MNTNDYYYTIAFILDFNGKTSKDYKVEELSEEFVIPEDACGFELRKYSCDLIKNIKKVERVCRVIVGRETTIDEILKYIPEHESHSNLYFMKMQSENGRFCREIFDAAKGNLNPAYMILKGQDIVVRDREELQEKFKETVEKVVDLSSKDENKSISKQ